MTYPIELQQFLDKSFLGVSARTRPDTDRQIDRQTDNKLKKNKNGFAHYAGVLCHKAAKNLCMRRQNYTALCCYCFTHQENIYMYSTV